MAGALIRMITDAFRSPIDDEDLDLSSWELINGSEDEEMVDDYAYDSGEDEIFILESPDLDLTAESSAPDLIDEIGVISPNRDLDEDEEDEEEDYDDGYDLDDELVPRSISDRFGRERMRELGKRAYPKMNKSSFNRPGSGGRG